MRTPDLVQISTTSRVREMPTIHRKDFSLQVENSAEKPLFPVPNTYLNYSKQTVTIGHVIETWAIPDHLIQFDLLQCPLTSHC